MWRSTGAFGFPAGVVDMRPNEESSVSKVDYENIKTFSYSGVGERTVTPLSKSGLRELRRDARGGNADAQFYLGWLYETGEDPGVPQDYDKSIDLYLASAQQGNASAQHSLGDMCVQGDEVDEGMKWLRDAADQGHAPAMTALGYVYEQMPGNISEKVKSDVEAATWFLFAAELGETDAQYRLGEMYRQGRAEAWRWGKDSTGAKELAACGWTEGQICHHGQHTNDVVAAVWFRLSASRGHARAQFRLGNAYAQGTGVGMDKERAVIWHEAAAAQGDRYSMYVLGCFFENGDGVPVDCDAAIRWYCLAAALGCDDSQNRLYKLVPDAPPVPRASNVASFSRMDDDDELDETEDDNVLLDDDDGEEVTVH